MEKGRKCDVLVEDNILRDPATGSKIFFGFHVWADDGMYEVIRAVEGVQGVIPYGTLYHVKPDKRYSRDWVAAEIEAAIKCAP